MTDNRYQPPAAPVADAPLANNGDELAPLGARLGAAVIDALLYFVILLPLVLVAGFWKAMMSGSGQLDFGTLVGLFLIGLVTNLVLHGYLLHRYGQTIGKRVAGTRIVGVADNAILPLWKILVLRWLPVGVVSQVPYVGALLAIGNVLFVFRSDRRCVHDFIAGTKVVTDSSPWHRPGSQPQSTQE
jgi:uncharacterized RDD family membrane protein YckC